MALGLIASVRIADIVGMVGEAWTFLIITYRNYEDDYHLHLGSHPWHSRVGYTCPFLLLGVDGTLVMWSVSRLT